VTNYAASVDFSIKTPYKNIQGLLHGLGNNSPSNETFAQLRPSHWRTVAGSGGKYTRIRAYDPNIKISVVCSDVYGGARPDLDAYAGWQTTINTLVAYHTQNDVIWDIWNEPDFDYVITQGGTNAQFFGCYKAAYDIIRTAYPKAIISGPCCANYNATFHTAFLDFCKANGMVIDYMTWHEFPDTDPSVIPTHVATVRALIASTYPALGIKDIGITEHTRDTSWMQPGDCLNYINYLQQANVAFASRACWNSIAAANTCFDGSMTNLVNVSYPGNAPKAPWWAYKFYADIQRSQVLCTSADTYLAVMAGCYPAKVLLGFGNSSTSTVDVTLTIKNPEVIGIGATSLTVTVYKVVPNGEADVLAPTFVSNTVVTITNHSGSFTITGINAHELYEVVFTD
jgi:xylan 1,4-beta-xylosidase